MWSISDQSDALHAPTDAAVKASIHAHAGQVVIDITYIPNDQFKAQLDAAIAGGNPPDIFQTWGGGVLQSYVTSGIVRDIPALSGDAGKRFSAGALAPSSFNGKHYAVPVDLAGVFLWVNTDILQRNNLPLPDTWTNLIADCRALHARGITPIVLTNRDKWPGAFWTYYLVDRLGGPQVFSNAYNRVNGGTFADPVFVQAGKMIQDAVDANCFEPGYNVTGYDNGQNMGSGQAVMQLQGNWLLGGMRAAGLNDTSIKALPFPAVEGGKGDPTDMVGGTGQAYAISARAPREAEDALIEMLSSESFTRRVAEAGLVSAQAGADKYINDVIVRGVAQAFGKAAFMQLYYDQFMTPELSQVFLQTNQDLFGKSTTPGKAAADLEAAAARAAPHK